MLRVTSTEEFDKSGKLLNEIKKGLYYGFTIKTKNTFDDNSCRDVLIEKIKLEYNKYLRYYETFDGNGFIVMNSFILLNNETKLIEFNNSVSCWIEECEKTKDLLEKVIKKFMPNSVGKIEIKVYCI